MRITTKGRYALRVMIDLAQNEKNGFVSISNISERQDISNKYLERIISKLTKAGLLKACRGFRGGYKLSKATSEYKIGDIIRASEGDLNIIDCVFKDECARKKLCKAYPFWKGLNDVINEYADSITLEELLKK